MATTQHASKRVAQNSNIYDPSTPTKTVRTKMSKPNTPVNQLKEKEVRKSNDMDKIQEMFKTVIKKLEKLDSMENDMKEIKASLEYAQAEIVDLKQENEVMKRDHGTSMKKVDKLERDNEMLRNKIVDLQARSMRDNLLFFNMPENDKENTTEMIHDLLENKLEIEDARNKIKIDRSHRIGRIRVGNNKPRPIVVKFNFHQDCEYVRMNAKKLKGTKIGISERFPEEIESIRKTLYPELKKAKREGKRAKIVKDKLIIEGQVYRPRS